MFRLAPYNNMVVKRNDDFYSLFDEFFNDFPTADKAYAGFKVDIQDNGKEYVFEAELPGVNKEDIKLDYKDNNLMIQVETSSETEEEKSNYIRKERKAQSMKRVFRVKDIQGDAVRAHLNNGVLTIVAPKVIEEDNSFNIDIQ